MTRPIIFLHVPKTAGTTLHSIIGLNYPNAQLFFTSPDSPRPFDEVAALTPKQRQKIKLYTGHFAFGLHKLLGTEATYITVLREPIDRSLSEFYHIRRDPDHGLHKLVQSGQLDMVSYFARLRRFHKDNMQTRLFAGDWLNSDEPTEANEAMLEKAKHNLANHFAVVGMTEQFDETLLLLKKAIGLRHLLYKNRNITTNRPTTSQITPEERAAVAQHNQYDLELYQFAQTLFREQIEQYGDKFHTDLKQLKLTQQTHFANRKRHLLQARMSTRNILLDLFSRYNLRN